MRIIKTIDIFILNQSRFALSYLSNLELNWAIDQVWVRDHAWGHSYTLDIIARLQQHVMCSQLIGQKAEFDYLDSTICPLNSFFGWIKSASYVGRSPDRQAYVYRLKIES